MTREIDFHIHAITRQMLEVPGSSLDMRLFCCYPGLCQVHGVSTRQAEVEKRF